MRRTDAEPYFATEAERWHHTPKANSRISLPPLISKYRLSADGLDEMYQRFRALQYKEMLYSVVGFLITSRSEDTWVEDRVFNAFTALEAISAVLAENAGETFTLRAEVFEQLCVKLRATIKACSTGLGLSKEVRSALYAKLKELNRPEIVIQIARAVEKYGVNWSDLWPPTPGLITELRSAYMRRSKLVHSGHLMNARASMLDAVRVHALAERLLYALVGGKSDWLDPEAYYHLPAPTLLPDE